MEYIHPSFDDYKFAIRFRTPQFDERTVPYNGSRVLVVRKTEPSGPSSVFVPGFVLRERRTNQFGERVSDVVPVSQQHQKDLERMLRLRGFREEITFWSEANHHIA